MALSTGVALSFTVCGVPQDYHEQELKLVIPMRGITFTVIVG